MLIIFATKKSGIVISQVMSNLKESRSIKNGQERLIRVEDEWLYTKGINEGDPWPDILLETKDYIF